MTSDHLRSAPLRRLLSRPAEEHSLWNIFGSVVSSIVAVALSLPLVLAFSILLPACLSIRWLLLFIHCNRHGAHSPEPESVRGNDRRWLGAEWRSSVIHAVLVFEAKEGVNVEHFRRLLLKRVIPLYPRLTKRLISLPILAGVGNCWLADANFSIDKHVFPGPSCLSNEKELQDYVSRLVDDGLPEDKSPWQLQVFQSFGINQDTVVVLRVHQSVADGTTLMGLLCHSLADTQIIELPERPRSGSLAFGMNVLRACIVGPLTLLIWILFSGEDCNIFTHRSTWTGSVTVTWSTSIMLPKVVRIKQVTRSTVNCVLLSALAGALRRLLQGCGVKQPPDVKIVVPVDLRDQTTRVKTKLGNKTSSLIMPLPVAIEGCVPRLWATRKTLDSSRSSADPVILYVATAALMSVGSATFARHFVNFFTGKASLQFSSIPGPISEVLLEGQTLKRIYPILPAQANLGISITIITYAEQIFISVLAERALGPAAKLILQYLEDQIETLWKLLLHRRVPGEQGCSALYEKNSGAESPVREFTSRLNMMQKEVGHFDSKESDRDRKTCSLKAELSELVTELKRRQSISEADNAPKKSRRKTGSRPKKSSGASSASNESTDADDSPAESVASKIRNIGDPDSKGHRKDFVISISERNFSFIQSDSTKSNNSYPCSSDRAKVIQQDECYVQSEKPRTKQANSRADSVSKASVGRLGYADNVRPEEKVQSEEGFGSEEASERCVSRVLSESEESDKSKGPSDIKCDFSGQQTFKASEASYFGAVHHFMDASQVKAGELDDPEIVGGVLI